jgi:hypothetical protein
MFRCRIFWGFVPLIPTSQIEVHNETAIEAAEIGYEILGLQEMKIGP